MSRLLSALALTAVAVLPLSAATVDGLKIHWASAGSGKTTLVFVHGWTCDSSSWGLQVPALAKNYRVITLDLPGHGKTGLPADGKFSMDLFARAVEAVRAEAKADKIDACKSPTLPPAVSQWKSVGLYWSVQRLLG